MVQPAREVRHLSLSLCHLLGGNSSVDFPYLVLPNLSAFVSNLSLSELPNKYQWLDVLWADLLCLSVCLSVWVVR